MPKFSFALPNGETVTVLAKARGFDEFANFLNKVRAGTATEDDERFYNNMKAAYARQLAALVLSENPNPEAIVVPPSSRQDAGPYRDEILAKHAPIDLSPRFGRRGEHKAADPKVTLEQMIHEITYNAQGDEDSLKSLTIVDETMGNGKTVAAIIYHLRASGLRPDCIISVAVALANH